MEQLTQPVTNIQLVNKHATSSGAEFVLPPGAIETSADRSQTVRAVQALLVGHNSVNIDVDGGDGTVGCAVEAVVRAGQNSSTLRLKNGGGNKKDLAAMTAQNGGQVDLRPLLLEYLNTEGKWELTRAVAYTFAVGAIAVGARIANSEKFRADMKAGKRIKAEADLAWQLLKPWAKIDGERVRTRAIVNGRKIGAFIVSNGDIVAGGAMRFRQQLGEHGFVTSTIGRSLPSKLFGLACRGITFGDRFVGVHHRDRWTTGTAGYQFSLDENTLAQADGEHFDLAAGTYHIRQPKTPVIQLVTEQT